MSIDTLTTRIIEFHENLLSWEQEVIKKTGLSSTQTHIVEYLEELEETDNSAPKMNTIARRMGITTGSLTVAIDRLEKKGFVRRQMLPDDRRSYRIVLTDSGRELHREHRRLHRELTCSSTVGFIEEEIEQLTDLLGRFTSCF